MHIRTVSSTLLTLGLFVLAANGQVVLTGTNYSQHFDALGSGLPAGWTVRTNANSTSLGAALAFSGAVKSWGDTAGGFGNFASVTNNGGSLADYGDPSATQAGFTNRSLGLRQGSSFGDPGAAFVLQVANTLGASNLIFNADLLMFRTNQASTTWTIDYAVGDSPASFTLLGTFPDPAAFGATHVSYPLGVDANNQSEHVWIRIAALTASTGGGIRDSFGVDNVHLAFVAPDAPVISQGPVSSTNAVATTAIFTASVSGNPPLTYRWHKGATPLTEGGNVSGSTSNTLTLSSILHADAGDYRLVATNSSGSVTSAVAALTVVGFAVAPVPPTNTVAGQPVSVALEFVDNQSPVNSGLGTSGNQAILPDANILVTAAGSSGTATLTPVAGTGGVVLARLSASDGNFSTNTTLPLLVVPSAEVLFNDDFDYADGPVIEGSHGLWTHESGTWEDLVVTGGELQVSRSLTEDASAELIGRPHTSSSDAVLYSRFRVRFTTLPAGGGGYFACFTDAAGAGQCARVWASTTNAAAGKFRLGIGNGSGSTATTAQVNQDLDLGTTYVVITRLVVSNATSSIWINPLSEMDASNTVFATATDVPASPSEFSTYAFRQAGSMGIMLVDGLVVGKTFAAVAAETASTPVLLSISHSGGEAILSWADATGQLVLAEGTSIGGITNVVATESPYTNVISESARFYRLLNP